MANAMVNSIAQTNVNGNQGGAYPASNQPYATLVYDPQASANYAHEMKMGTVSGQDNSATGYASASSLDPGGVARYYTSGANGAGVYRQQTPEELARSAQQYYATQFRNNIPQTENTLYTQMASGVNQSMNQGIKNVQQRNSNRGLLYGGVNAGQEGAVRANAASQLAEGRSSINSSVENAANTMDQQAIDTGIAVQQQQQQIQNAVYANAMAQMNNQNGLIGGALSAIGTGVGMYLGAGTPTGAMAGGLIGQQIGKAAG